jgi:hypothetical protein
MSITSSGPKRYSEGGAGGDGFGMSAARATNATQHSEALARKADRKPAFEFGFGCIINLRLTMTFRKTQRRWFLTYGVLFALLSPMRRCDLFQDVKEPEFSMLRGCWTGKKKESRSTDETARCKICRIQCPGVRLMRTRRENEDPRIYVVVHRGGSACSPDCENRLTEAPKLEASRRLWTTSTLSDPTSRATYSICQVTCLTRGNITYPSSSLLDIGSSRALSAEQSNDGLLLANSESAESCRFCKIYPPDTGSCLACIPARANPERRFLSVALNPARGVGNPKEPEETQDGA